MSMLTLTLTTEDLKALDAHVNAIHGATRESVAVEALRKRLAEKVPKAAAKAKAIAGAESGKE